MPSAALPEMDVVICTLNSEHAIDACIESVLREVPVRQMHVIDGGSTDSTLAKVRAFPQVLVHSRPDLSLGQSRAFAMGLPETEWFLQIDSDVVLREGWASMAAEQLGRADVLEFGTVDHFEFLNPAPEDLNTRRYQRRALFFANLIRTAAVREIDLDYPPLRNFEEELTRRLMRQRGRTWIKTGITHADHYTRPVRYQGRSIVRLTRRRPFPAFVHQDRGRVDGMTGVGVGRAIVVAVWVMAETVLGPIRRAFDAVGNPIAAALEYGRGYREGRKRAASGLNARRHTPHG